jgi:NitT/TauT family transport system permease protein
MPHSERRRQAALGVAGVALFALVWEAYKAFGRAVEDRVFGIGLPAHTDDASMPHLWTVARTFGQAEVRGEGRTIAEAVLGGMWYSFRLALGGFALGLAIGIVLAVAMTRFRIVERAWLPYIVLSQTVPLVALAPLVVGWGGQLRVFGRPWEAWMTVTAMAAYLAFFPVAVGTLRGLHAAKPASLELMQSYAASWWQTLVKLRFPMAVPYLLPAVKLAAAAAIVGAIVAEISTGVPGGIGRLIITYFQKATGNPAQVYTAFAGAAVLGLVAAGLIALVERVAMRNRPKGDPA